jgi:hypothetical protein
MLLSLALLDNLLDIPPTDTVLRAFNDAASIADVMWYGMRCEDGHEY